MQRQNEIVIELGIILILLVCFLGFFLLRYAMLNSRILIGEIHNKRGWLAASTLCIITSIGFIGVVILNAVRVVEFSFGATVVLSFIGIVLYVIGGAIRFALQPQKGESDA